MMNDTKKILLVEDDPEIVENLTEFLRTEGYFVTSVSTQKETMELLDRERFDLMLLDVTLKQGNGYSVCTAVKAKYDMPVIFLTARDSIQDRIAGLDLGADDYLVKPFDFDELLARIRAATRKYGAQKTSVLTLADLTVDTVSHTVARGGKEIRLSAKEYAVLEYMLQNRGTVISRTRLEDHIWNYDYAGGSNVVDVYITYLRKKIDAGFDKKLIHTVRGAGWVMKEEP